MKSSEPGALRFVLVASSISSSVVAQQLIRDGNLIWAVAPIIVAVAAIVLSVARRSLSNFDKQVNLTSGPSYTEGHQCPKTAPCETRDTVAASHRLQVLLQRWTRSANRELLAGAGVTLVSIALLCACLVLFSDTQAGSRTLAWYAFGASVVTLLTALPTLEYRWSALLLKMRSEVTLRPSPGALAPWAILGVVLIIGLLLRLYQLDQLPAGLWYDEADNIFQARQIAIDPGRTQIYIPSTNLPSLFLLPIALVVKLTDVTITTGRLVSVAFGLSGIVAVFLLVRLALGSWAGLVAALLTTFMRWDLNWSRIGMHGITAPLFAALTAYLTLRALRSGRLSDFGFAGASLGLGMWFYASLRLFPLVAAFMLIHHLIIQRPSVRKFSNQVAIMVAVSLFVAAPIILTAAQDSDQFFKRTRETSIFTTVPKEQVLGELKRNVIDHALMFNERGDSNPRHNLPKAPMLDFLTGALLLLGLGIALTRWRDVALISLPFWIFFMVLPGVFTVPFESPQSLRSIAVIPAVAALGSLVVIIIWRAGREAPWRLVRIATAPFVLALLGIIIYSNIATYFSAQANDPRVFAAFSTAETLMSRHMTEQQSKGHSLWLSRHFRFSPTVALMANDPHVEVIKAPENIPLDSTRLRHGVSIYLEPRESSFYQTLKEYYPDGRFMEIRAPGGGDVLYYSAVISHEQMATRQGLQATYRLADGSQSEQIDITEQGIWHGDQGPSVLPYELVWEGSLHIPRSGEYRLLLGGTASAVVELDHRPILTSVNREVKIVPAVGLHELSIRATIVEREDFVRLVWQPPGEGPRPVPFSNLYHGSVRPVGLAGRFYEGRQEKEIPDATHTTPSMGNFYYTPVVPRPYVAVWTGALTVEVSGQNIFRLDGVGTIKLTINGSQVALKPAGVGNRTRKLHMEAGVHQISVEHHSLTAPSEFNLLWAPPDRPLMPIPLDRMAPDWGRLFRIVE